MQKLLGWNDKSSKLRFRESFYDDFYQNCTLLIINKKLSLILLMSILYERFR